MEPQVIKCVVVGDGAVGKTSLLMSYATNRFPTEYIPTIFDNYVVTINIGGEKYTLGLYDTAGQEDYDRLRPLTYNHTDVFLVCFSVVLPSSFDNIRKKWIPEVKHYCSKSRFVLVGTQIDLRQDSNIICKLANRNQRPVAAELAEKLAKHVKAEKYIECSARTMEGIKDVFDEAIIAALKPPKQKSFNCSLL